LKSKVIVATPLGRSATNELHGPDEREWIEAAHEKRTDTDNFLVTVHAIG
jgi:hypothetical protein